MENITYEEFIQNILDTRGRFACGDEYHERHHIVPKSCGGTNDEENLIDLFAREHFEAHRLLALENPDNEKLVYAWSCMAFVKSKHTKERYQLTEEEYEEAKDILSKTQREIQKKRFEDPKERIKNGEYTKKQYENPDRRKKQSETMKKKYEDPEMRKKTGDASKRMWQNNEYRQKQIDIALIISNTPEGIKARSDGAKKKWSDPSAHKKHSNRMSGGKNPRAKKVIRLFDGFVYDCMKDAANNNNMSLYTLRDCCSKHKDFMYYDEFLIITNYEVIKNEKEMDC